MLEQEDQKRRRGKGNGQNQAYRVSPKRPLRNCLAERQCKRETFKGGEGVGGEKS